MSDHPAIVRLYVDALAGDDDTIAVASDHLAGDVVAQSNFGRAEGKVAVVASLGNSMVAGLLAAAQWGEPEVDGNTVSLMASLPPGMPVGGFAFVFAFNEAGEIQRVEQQMIPAVAPESTDLELTEEIKNTIDNALDNGTPVLVAYVDDEGQPHLSFRGTTQVYSAHQLALWARDPDAGLTQNVPRHSRITLLYHDAKTRTTYNFYGRAHVVEDEVVRAAIFENSNPREQNMDFRRQGVALLVDLDKVDGSGPLGRFRMERKA